MTASPFSYLQLVDHQLCHLRKGKSTRSRLWWIVEDRVDISWWFWSPTWLGKRNLMQIHKIQKVSWLHIGQLWPSRKGNLTRLSMNSFQAMYSDVRRTTSPIQLVLDFDGTLTGRDTMEVMAKIGYAEQAKHGRPVVPWSEIINGYMEDWNEHVKNYEPSADGRTTLTDELAWLTSLENVERASFRRAISAGIFEGVTTSTVKQVVCQAISDKAIKMRTGWLTLIKYVQMRNEKTWPAPQRKTPVQIISVNWSRMFIHEVLKQSLLEDEITEDGLLAIDSIGIYANELPPLQASRDMNSHLLPNGLHTSQHKVSLLKDLKQPYIGIESEGYELPIAIYVGDSTTDLACLCQADIGICIRAEPITSSQKELAATCERIGVVVQALSEAYGLSAHPARPLYYVKDFCEIHDWLLRQERPERWVYLHSSGYSSNHWCLEW